MARLLWIGRPTVSPLPTATQPLVLLLKLGGIPRFKGENRMDQGRARRILIVDDEEAVLISYEMILTREGFEVTTAESAASASGVLQNEHYDLLMCDLSLERGTSGFDIIREAINRSPGLPVILMTGYSDTVLPSTLGHANIRVVSKPASIPDLLNTMRSMLGLATKTDTDAAD